MTTAADIIKGALRRIQVIASETPIEADEIQDGLEDLNDFGSQTETGFIALGFIPMSSAADTINIPLEANGFYKDHLAIYLAGQYGAPVPQTLLASAELSKAMVLNTFQGPIDVEFPDTLPLGTGNTCDNTFENQKFFKPNNSENF